MQKLVQVYNQINHITPIYFLGLMMYKCHYWGKLEYATIGTGVLFLQFLVSL